MLIEDKEIIKVDLRYLSINDIEITEDYSLMDLRKYRIKSKINCRYPSRFLIQCNK